MTAAPSTSRLSGLVVPGIATALALAVLVGLGLWQIERKAWKEGLIDQIAARAYGAAGDPVPEQDWSGWRAEDDEFRRVRIAGTFLPDALVSIHGIAEERPGQALLGYYLFEPLRRSDGSIVIVNRGFVPVEVRDQVVAALKAGSSATEVSGLVRAPESHGWFLPANDPRRGEWFVRSLDDMSSASGLTRVAPFYVDADATPRGEPWPRAGQTPLTLRNPHLQYAVTWFGLACTLVGVFAAFALRHLRSTEDQAGGEAIASPPGRG